MHRRVSGEVVAREGASSRQKMPTTTNVSTAINIKVDRYGKIKNKIDSSEVEVRLVARVGASSRQKMSTTTSGSTAINISGDSAQIDTLKQRKRSTATNKTKQASG